MKAIAMKCTQEQFNTVKGKLEGMVTSLSSFDDYPYLVTDYMQKGKYVSNISERYKKSYGRKVHKTWNEEIFLNACGIDTDYRITKEQILKAHNSGFIHIKQWFPDAFKTDLEVRKWYKWMDMIIFIYEIKDKRCFYYGIDQENWIVIDWIHIDNDFEEATPQEIETALIAEAKKRGLIDNNHIESTSGIKGIIDGGNYVYASNFNKFYYSGFEIFDNGKWATITPTLTLKEAEEKLNCKIV